MHAQSHIEAEVDALRNHIKALEAELVAERSKSKKFQDNLNNAMDLLDKLIADRQKAIQEAFKKYSEAR